MRTAGPPRQFSSHTAQSRNLSWPDLSESMPGPRIRERVATRHQPGNYLPASIAQQSRPQTNSINLKHPPNSSSHHLSASFASKILRPIDDRAWQPTAEFLAADSRGAAACVRRARVPASPRLWKPRLPPALRPLPTRAGTAHAQCPAPDPKASPRFVPGCERAVAHHDNCALQSPETPRGAEETKGAGEAQGPLL